MVNGWPSGVRMTARRRTWMIEGGTSVANVRTASRNILLLLFLYVVSSMISERRGDTRHAT